ncbi:MAG: hypothetical protein SVM80_03245 [Halobacteriota archaeon]|nr:hypothetical protein [Halobacteriota archaeon]
MEITVVDAVALTLSFLYLLIIPGLNVLRTTGKLESLEIEETVLISIGIGIIILTFISLMLSLPGSAGLNLYNLLIAVTIFIVISTKEVVHHLRRAIGI